MNYVEALDACPKDTIGRRLFLAGGITNCPDWQQDMVGLLRDTDLTLLNPRRSNFPIDDPNATVEQIGWEWFNLRIADAILFWFPMETLCPIVLFELGAHSMTSKPIFVGVHPDYKRRQDVEVQMSFSNPRMEIVYSLQDLANLVKEGWR